MGPGHVTGWSRRTSTQLNLSTLCLLTLCLLTVCLSALCTATLITFALSLPAAAQSEEDEAAEEETPLPPIFLTVTAQSSVVAADGSFLVEVAITPPDLLERRDEVSEFELAVVVFDRVVEEPDVDLPPSVPLNRLESIRLGDLVTNQAGHYRLQLPLRSNGDDQTSRVLLTEPGVYPVTIELRNDEGAVAATRTNLIRLAADDQGPDALPFSQPLGVAAALTVVPAEGVTVDDARRLLLNHPETPITVLMSEGVASQLRADPELAGEFTQAVGDRAVVTGPMVDLDPSALAEIGQPGIYHRALRATWDDLRRIGLEPLTDTTVVTRPLTAAGVETLGEMGITTVIDTSQTLATNGYVQSGGHRIDLLRFDSDLSELFAEGTSGVVQANRVLAHLTLRAQNDNTPVVLGGPALGQRPIDGLDVFLGWLDETDAPRALALTEAAGGNLRRRLAERPTQNLAADASLLADIDSILEAFEAMYVAPGVIDSTSAWTTPDDYRRRLWSALALDRNVDDRRRALLVFSEELGQELEVITLPAAQTVTMAARDGSVPLIVESRAAGPRQIMLRFRSDKFKVVQDAQLVTVEPGTSSIDVEVQARSLGSSQIEVSVWSPDGQLRLASNKFQVRSTAVPGLGLLISGGALLSLVVWWFIDHRRSRDGTDESATSGPGLEGGLDVTGDVVERGQADGPAGLADQGDRRRLVGHE